MKVKLNGFELSVCNEYVECEVQYNNTVWYFLEEYLTDELVELVETYINKEISLLDFVISFFDGVEFEDEDEKRPAYEFTLKDWKDILE